MVNGDDFTDDANRALVGEPLKLDGVVGGGDRLSGDESSTCGGLKLLSDTARLRDGCSLGRH